MGAVKPHQVAVAATGQVALDAGLGVAADGGNAIDAAMAAALVALVTEPGIVSIGGGGFISVWPAGGEPVVIDGSVEMPGRGLAPECLGGGIREISTEYGGGVTMHAGHGSVATPGIVPGLGVAHERFARLDWARLLEPAIAAARHGFPMSSAASLYLGYTANTLFGADPEAHALVTRKDGTVLAGGELTSNTLVADTLEQLAAEGPRLFTHGSVARSLVADMATHGGLITAEDLTAYEAVMRPAYSLEVGDWQIATNPPPAVGGPMLAIMLGELARRDAANGAWTWADVIAIQRAVLGYRTAVHDHSPDLAEDGHELLRGFGEAGLAALRTSPSTAHISAVDTQGNACAITMSSGYGAGMTIPGTGILLNNSLGEIELNRRGLHSAAPGTRLASNMAPTTARTADGRALAIGSPGADRITTALMLVLGQGCLRGADLRQAIADPRLHLRLTAEGSFRAEYERDPDITAAVAASGLEGHEYPEPHMYFGGVGAAYHFGDGRLEAAGDSRRAAATGVS